MLLKFIFTQEQETLWDKKFDGVGWEYPERGLIRCKEAGILDYLIDEIEQKMIEGRNKLIILSQSESVLRRLQRYVAESTPENFYRHDNCEVWFCMADGTLIDMGLTHYGQLSVRQPDNFFDTISDDLDAMTDAALAIRIKELENQ